MGGEALLIDPIAEQLPLYEQLLRELDLKLLVAVDSHSHTDHQSALPRLTETERCITMLGEHSPATAVHEKISEGERLRIDGLTLYVLFTPGHTADSYSFSMEDRIFTGDTLLIRSTGRCDLEGGSAEAQYDSLFNKIMRLPDETQLFPGHDYRGLQTSTIGEERWHNPRLQVESADHYAEIMAGLNVVSPRLMDEMPPTPQSGY